MTQQHPELADEQAYVDFAYECLERTKESAWRLRDLNEADLGGTFQARFERNAFDEALLKRLADLDLGDAALVFGRIDRLAEAPEGRESFHIGRLAVADEQSDPVVVDWRAPVAEPFYRATGREPMGLVRRRHFVVEGRRLLGLEDELFGDGHLGVGHDEGLGPDGDARLRLRGYSTLLATLERDRTGTLGDIVATIQAEQDEIIRSPQAGVLVVQGGPGTGKTVVGLHRAAYLLYTHRFPLEDQGVLVIGPNRVFLRYIERVLPSLGEAGVEQVVLADLVPDVRFARAGVDAGDSPLAARVKGDVRMASVLERAVRERQRPLRQELTVPFRTGFVRLGVGESARIVKAARRRGRRHNSGRRLVEAELFAALAASWRGEPVSAGEVRAAVRREPDVRAALERMWPVLTPAALLHDLFGAPSLLRLAAGDVLGDEERRALERPRAATLEDVRWSAGDVALLDEARAILGPVPDRAGRVADVDEIRTYGHLVVDEVQDLTPMQLRMVARRSLNGSVTAVGDLAQATGPVVPDTWDEVLAHLPDRTPGRVVGLSVGYRIPAQIMEFAERVVDTTPARRAPTAVRIGDAGPSVIGVAEPDDLLPAVADETAKLLAARPGNIAVVAPDELVDDVSDALSAAGIAHGRATRSGLDDDVTVVPVSVVKGLELDAVVVVEPGRIADRLGPRALYVALTRATKRLSVVHTGDLPTSLR